MAPAEHYAEAERILREVNEAAAEFHAKLPDDTRAGDPMVIKAAELTAASLAMGIAEAQVHATLATVSPGGPPEDYDQLVAIARALDAQPPVANDVCAICHKDVYDPDDHQATCAYRIAFRWATEHPETS